ncbi:hypothetical protein POM88_022941 [Heracleum sosnowskyi]|uniref:Uncharacterized protein n=1 Tax=Heracleum sosnowskyi TaxID=360622 RepID=A0AAD8IGQ5_9APIA|nr:hypothetical protein POM88_022941 [Heracleum sosnowskyi]
MKCLRKLIGSRRVLGSLETTYQYHNKCVSNNPIHTPTTCSVFLQSHSGLANKFSPNPRSVCSGRCDSDTEILESKEKQFQIIQKGDTVNLSQLLFTKNRDYLIRYNHPQLVTAHHLAGKEKRFLFTLLKIRW